MPACTNDDAIIAKAEASLISTKPGAVPPHLDVGGHLPFGGTTHNGTGGRSAFGKRKIVTSAGTGNNPRALLLNYPPPSTEANIRCWEVNYKSSVYQDPVAEIGRHTTSNQTAFGAVRQGTSCLADANRTYGDVRQSDRTRPTPSPAFEPPERTAVVPEEQAEYRWHWPERTEREPPPRLVRPTKVTHKDFYEEYQARPPWLKY